MRFGFLNNFGAQLAAPVADDATEIELSTGAEAIATALEGSDAIALTLFVRDDQGNETKREVVYATAVTESVVTVERAQENTETQRFSAGDRVEARLTAGSLILALESVKYNWLNLTEGKAILIGDGFIGGVGLKTVILGVDSQAGEGESNVSIGYRNRIYGNVEKCVVVGADVNVEGVAAIAIGNLATVMNKCDYALAIGLQSNVASSESVALGVDSSVSRESEGATAIGARAAASGVGSVAIGGSARTSKDLGIAIGTAFADKRGSLAQGALATTTVDFGEKKHAIPYLSKEPFPVPEVYQSQLPPGVSLRDVLQPSLGNVPDIVGLVSQQVIFGSYPIDLTDNTSSAVIELPANTLFLPDAIDVIIVASEGAGGSPAIQVGPNDANPDSYLAITAINKTAVGGRETFVPLMRDGIASLRVSVATAGTGTLSAKMVVRGYVMEL